MLYPFPMVNGLITMAEESAAICTFDVIVFGVANTPFTNKEPGEITTVFAVPFIPTVTFPDAVVIATLLVPLVIALPCCDGKFVKKLPSPIKYEPATLPLAVTFPAVLMLPAEALPVTVNAVNDPTDVMLVCAAVVSVPATLVKSPNVPDTLPVDTLPVTLSEPNVPKDVILVWLAVVSVPAMLVNTALVAPILPTVALPVTLSDPPVLKLPALTLPL